MTTWKNVVWTEAGQVTALLGWDPSPDDGVTPEAFFVKLRADGREDDAAMFLGQALPRYEAVAWAAEMVLDLCPPPVRKPEEDALKATLLWLQDPAETRRRNALLAGEAARETSPQRMCAMAAFFSGGSLAPQDTAPVPSPKDLTGKFAAGAVIVAAHGPGQPDGALGLALDAGEVFARGEGKSSR